MQKTLLIILGVAVLLIAGFFAFNAYIYHEKQGDGMAIEPYRAVLSGQHV